MLKEIPICPICEENNLYEINNTENKTLYRCLKCTMDSDEFDYGEYMEQIRAFNEAIKDWI